MTVQNPPLPLDDKPSPAPELELFHVEQGPASADTIVFLHSLFTCHLESAAVVPHLADYHLLLADLNGHSGSAAVRPHTIQAMADGVAALIRRRAHGGAAHVVGTSMGGFTALELARRYPELVRSVFSAGAVPPDGFAGWLVRRPSLSWYLLQPTMAWVPGWLLCWAQARRGVVLSADLHAAMLGNLRWEVTHDVLSSMALFSWDDLAGVRARTLGVAGGLDENVEAMKREGDVLSENAGEGSRAVVVRHAVHAWILQHPELFAKGVRAWIEGGELPKEFEAL